MLFLNFSYSDLRVLRWVTGAVTSCKAGAEHVPKVHVATEEPTCPLREADAPKSVHFRHMPPSLPTLSLVLVARDRGLWGWVARRPLSGVPEELLSPRGGGSAHGHPTSGWGIQKGHEQDQTGWTWCWKNENSGERERFILPNHLKRSKDTYICFCMCRMPHLVAHPQVLQMGTSWNLWGVANMSCSCCYCQTQPVSTARWTHVYRDTIVGPVITVVATVW